MRKKFLTDMQTDTITPSIPGYRVYEYMLVLRPHVELQGRILHLKQEFSEKYKTAETARSRTWIPLVHFTQRAMLEERIINRLRNVAMGFPPFKTELKDFGSFPSHTICINVTSTIPIQQLVKAVRSNCQRLMKMSAEQKPHFILEPHITIARKLSPEQYEKGWLEYSHRHFTGRFIAEEMMLFKRAEGESRYQPVTTFSFDNLPVLTKQGELF